MLGLGWLGPLLSFHFLIKPWELDVNALHTRFVPEEEQLDPARNIGACGRFTSSFTTASSDAWLIHDAFSLSSAHTCWLSQTIHGKELDINGIPEQRHRLGYGRLGHVPTNTNEVLCMFRGTGGSGLIWSLPMMIPTLCPLLWSHQGCCFPYPHSCQSGKPATFSSTENSAQGFLAQGFVFSRRAHSWPWHSTSMFGLILAIDEPEI